MDNEQLFYVSFFRRKTVICDECGKVTLFEVDISESAKVLSSQSINWDTPTTSVALFNQTKPDSSLGMSSYFYLFIFIIIWISLAF